MRIKTLFSIPDGEKVTEKALRRVLISSICSILLCMTCLVSTTWAWFAVSIENTENIIQIAQWSLEVSIKPTATLAETEEETSSVQYENGVYTLQEGEYVIDISFSSTAQGNDLDQAKVYLIMVENVGQTEKKYDAIFTLGDDGSYMPIQKTYEVGPGEQAELSFYFTRMNPQIDNDLITAVFEVDEEATNESTEESTQETTDPSDPSESIDPAEPPAGDEADSAEPPADDETDSAEPPTDDETDSAEPPADDETDPAEPPADDETDSAAGDSDDENTETEPLSEPTATSSTE